MQRLLLELPHVSSDYVTHIKPLQRLMPKKVSAQCKLEFIIALYNE